MKANISAFGCHLSRRAQRFCRQGQHRPSDRYNGNIGSYVKIELLKNNSLNRTISSYTSKGSNGSGSYNWAIPSTQTPGSDYRIRVTSYSNSSVKDIGDADFTITPPPPPEIIVTFPDGSEILEAGTARTIRWNYNGDIGSYVKIELLKNNVLTRTISSYTSKGSNGSGSYNWTIPSTQTPDRITESESPAYRNQR